MNIETFGIDGKAIPSMIAVANSENMHRIVGYVGSPPILPASMPLTMCHVDLTRDIQVRDYGYGKRTIMTWDGIHPPMYTLTPPVIPDNGMAITYPRRDW
jgi:hypothetical protein